jgi:hypothetical protein
MSRLRRKASVVARRSPFAPLVDAVKDERELHRWVHSARDGAAPALVKRSLLRSIAAARCLKILVETGTFFGATTYALRNDFHRILTIELDETLAKNASRRLRAFPHITVVQGNSAEHLPTICDTLGEPALFFLDGHYSGGQTARADKDSPVLDELAILFGHRADHVIVIDDARCFVGDGGYPTVDELCTFVYSRAPRMEVRCFTDMFVLLQRSQGFDGISSQIDGIRQGNMSG